MARARLPEINLLERRGYLQIRPNVRTAPPFDERMSRAQRWTTWKLKEVEGKEKPSKIPDSNITDPTTWTYFHAARAKLSSKSIAGIGFQMYGRPGIVGIDIDNCINKIGMRSKMLEEFLKILEKSKIRCHVEKSPSALGVRIFAGETDLPFHDFTNKTTGVEVYTGESGRYLCYTGARLVEFSELEGPFDPLPLAAIEWLAKHASRMKGTGGPTDIAPGDDPVPELLRRSDWKDLAPFAIRKIGKPHLEFLERGEVSSRYASASEQLFAVEAALIKNVKDRHTAYQILVSAEGSWNVALEHRDGDAAKARAFLWNDLRRALEAKAKKEKERAEEESTWKSCGIDVEVTDDGARAKQTQINVIRAFERHRDWAALEYDTFNNILTLSREPLSPRQVAEMSAWAMTFLKWPFEYHRNLFLEALDQAGRARPFNPVEGWLRGVEWDGKNRLPEFYRAVVGDAPERIDEEILRRWLIGYVARGIQPGCQMDTMLCLRGPEGAGKTSFARILAGRPEWFTDAARLGLDTDASMLRIGRRIIELGEGVAVRRSDKAELKMDITRTYEDFRPPYGRGVIRVPRAFVYVLTANPKTFLRSDQDGLRRIWPIDVAPSMALEWIEANLGQILAQAVMLFDKGERWWFDPRKDAPELIGALRERQLGCVAEDPLDSAIEKVIEGDERGWRPLHSIILQVEGIVGRSFSMAEKNHLADLLGKHGFMTNNRGGRRVWTHPSWWANAPAAKVVSIGGAPE